LEESTVLSYGGNGSVLDKSHRSSKTAYLTAPNDPPESIADVVLSCIEHRAASFQGYVPIENIEPLQVVKYTFLNVVNGVGTLRPKSFERITIGFIPVATIALLAIQETEYLRSSCTW
jgi:hypothetical protein